MTRCRAGSNRGERSLAATATATAGCRGRRHRYLGFVSAVVLFVLLAAAGLPLDGATAPTQHIAAGDRAVEHAVRRAARGEPAVVEAAGGAASAAPRPVSRQRCIAARGLPPARAPCA